MYSLFAGVAVSSQNQETEPPKGETIAMLLAYDGQPYCGWQRQSEGVSVQSVVESALSIPCRVPISIIGASRTDAGVHAWGQVAHAHIPHGIDPARLFKSLNGLLPDPVRCRALVRVPERFHSQLWAKGKLYTYRIQCGPVRDPLRRTMTAHWPYAYDLERMRAFSQRFIGTHDFAAFANSNTEGQAGRDSVRTVWSMEIQQVEDELRIHVEGNGFLYKMVRNLVGALLELGQGRLTEEQLLTGWQSCDRALLPPPAPAEGLCLMRIDYAEGLGGGGVWSSAPDLAGGLHPPDHPIGKLERS